MPQAKYRWRELTLKQRFELLAWRKAHGHPWHSPPHRPNFGHLRFHVTAACFEHQPYIGHSAGRMDEFARDLLAVLAERASQTFAWCLLPNHYHMLVEAPEILGLLHELGKLHGRTGGTARRIHGGERYSSASSSGRCVRTGTTGPR